jgi:hypothetical protein
MVTAMAQVENISKATAMQPAKHMAMEKHDDVSQIERVLSASSDLRKDHMVCVSGDHNHR